MTASDGPHLTSPGMPPACGYEVWAEFDNLVIRDDFIADLAGNTSHRLLEFQPQLTINTKGQLELHLTVPGPDVWTSLLTAMTVIRQSGYAPIAVHVLDNPESTSTHVQSPGNHSSEGRLQANGNRQMRARGSLDSVYSSSGGSALRAGSLPVPAG